MPRQRADRCDWRSPVDGVLEVRLLHHFAVADLQQIPLEDPRRVHQVPRTEPKADGVVVLSIRAQVYVRERVISKSEHAVVVQDVLRSGGQTADRIIECAAEYVGGPTGSPKEAAAAAA